MIYASGVLTFTLPLAEPQPLPDRLIPFQRLILWLASICIATVTRYHDAGTAALEKCRI